MNVHKILNGPGAAKYLPFAMSKLRFLVSLAQPCLVQAYTLDNARIIIKCNTLADQHHIRIDANPGSVGYEFFSTFDGIDAFPTNWRATAVSLPPALTGTKLSSAFDIEGKVVPQTSPVPRDPMARAINGQRNAEYHWWPAKDGVTAIDALRTKSYFMTSTLGTMSWQAPNLDFQSYLSGYITKNNEYAIPYEFGTDVGVDIAPTFYEKGQARTALPYPALPNWPRRAACLEVEGRRFVIMSDMQSNFYAFPESYLTGDAVKYAFHESRAKVVTAAEYMPSGVCVPSTATMVKRARGAIVSYGELGWVVPPVGAAPVLAPYGDWPEATTEPGADETKQFQRHQYLWDFRGDGKRACAVVHRNKRLITDSGAPWSVLSEYGPQYHIKDGAIGTGWVAAAGGTEQLAVTERGVLEVEFSITLTGERGVDDFIFSVGVSREIAGGWFFDAQYAFCDSRLEKLGVHSMDLLTDELRLYASDAGSTTATPTVVDSFIVTRNQNTSADVASHSLAMNRGFYMTEGFRSVWASLGTYPGIPPAIYRFNINDTTPTGDYALGRMIASDLRSMSKVLHRSLNGSAIGLHATVFGVTRKDKGLQGYTEANSIAKGLTRIQPAFLGVGTEQSAAVSLGLHRLVWEQHIKSYGFDGSVSTGIASHPDGHFAVFAHYYGVDDVFDLIESRRVEVIDDKPVEKFYQTTHLKAFKQAFGFDIDMIDYASAVMSSTPTVVQRFSSWRNIKLQRTEAKGYFAMNERLKDPK